MKPVAIVTMIIGAVLMLLLIATCGAIITGMDHGYCQANPQASSCH